MQCPICKSDLSPLDLVSRNEHVNICVENGPSTLEFNDLGRPVIKRIIDPKKQRKICPICDKTFQNIHSHFKPCALKFDIPPDLMFEYWDKINQHSKNPKKFPRDLLDNFVTKCIKEGRVGEQVEIAKALSMSLSDGQDVKVATTSSIGTDLAAINSENNNIVVEETTRVTTNVERVLMQNAASSSRLQSASNKPKKRYRLEIVDESAKQSNIELRMERELAASRSLRYMMYIESLKDNSTQIDKKENDDDDCVIILSQSISQQVCRLFDRARLKDSETCTFCNCDEHSLLLDVFQNYSGPTMDAPPKTLEQQQELNLLANIEKNKNQIQPEGT